MQSWIRFAEILVVIISSYLFKARNCPKGMMGLS
jgi:hypothetical protein